MLKLLTVLLTTELVALHASGQGRVNFNNFDAGLAPVTITTLPGMFNPNDGPPGAFVGSNYTASLYFVNGTVSTQADFDSLNPIWRADAVFFGTTGIGPGHGVGGDGSGFFEGGLVTLVGQTDFPVTVQVRAWYNGGGVYASSAQSLAAGHNVGQLNLLPLFAGPPPPPPNNLDGLLPFTVGIAEPSALALTALGATASLLLRRQHRP